MIKHTLIQVFKSYLLSLPFIIYSAFFLCQLTTVISPGLREFFPNMDERAEFALGKAAAPFKDRVISVTSCPL